ncbi:MAG TPA: aldehyde dehydrogenase family protein [Gemmatimonadales bacterium]|nr:aldehyde dehydrogenase family protein [Gemmatimonadales bacterium]
MTTLLSHFIAGASRPSSGGATLQDLNPSDARDVVAELPVGTGQDAAAAVAAASEALPSWRRMTGPARAELLHRWAAAIDGRAEEMAQLLAREVGKPIAEARGEVGRCIVILRYYAGDAVRSVGEVVPAQSAGALQYTLREPLGVVALITPWNFPVAIPLWKAAPALAFGNTVVLKPSEHSPAAALLLAETANSAGLPPGVFNVLLGSGAEAGEALLRADAVRGVSFTGSAAVGKRVAAIGAERNIRYQTEMGGKNVVIVLPDADLDLAARLTAAGAMRYAGQKCTATSRAIVSRKVEGPFLDKLRAQVDGLALGPVTDPAAAVGPVISAASRDRIRTALGAVRGEVVIGGGQPQGAAFTNGYFVTPTIVRGVSADDALAQEELFGPVLAVLEADGLDDAIGLANHSRYGLSASLFTRDIGAALRYIHQIEVGLVRVNGDTTGVDPHAPFGGMKGSSSGSREQGTAAREFYTETKTVQVSPA